LERHGFGKSGPWESKLYQGHRAFRKVSVANLASTSRLF
jgi:hypothetical protein